MLTRKDLIHLVAAGHILCNKDAVQQVHIDVTLNNIILFEDTSVEREVTLRKDKVTFSEHDLTESNFYLRPKGFILGSIREKINMPLNMSGMFLLDSNLARCGLEHSLAILILPGWSGFLTTEFFNTTQVHTLKFERDLPIGKIVFFEHEHTEPYKGKYVNQKGTTA